MMQATDSTFSCAALLIFTITWGRWCICVLSWNEVPNRIPVTGCGKTRESRFLTAKAVRNDKEYRVERVLVNSCPRQIGSKPEFFRSLLDLMINWGAFDYASATLRDADAALMMTIAKRASGYCKRCSAVFSTLGQAAERGSISSKCPAVEISR